MSEEGDEEGDQGEVEGEVEDGGEEDGEAVSEEILGETRTRRTGGKDRGEVKEPGIMKEVTYMHEQERRKRRSRPRKKESTRRSTWETGSRRSSMSVMTLTVKKTEKRKKKFFPKSDLTPQSRTAVHYLAISPPRIRITDTSRDNSPTSCQLLTVTSFSEKIRC